MGFEEFQCLYVRQVSIITADTSFQKKRIVAFLKHGFIIICLQEGRMALAEVAYHMLAGSADVGEDTDSDPIPSYRKTVGFRSIMSFRERLYAEPANAH